MLHTDFVAKLRATALLLASLSLATTTALAQPSATAWNVLHDAFADKNPMKKKQAITAIGSIGPTTESIRLLKEALHDDDPVMRQTAAAVLGQNKFRQCIPELKAALDDEDGEVAFTSAKALWDMGDHSGREVIDAVLSGERKDATGMVEGAKRDAKAKLHDPKSLALIGAREASGALLGPFSIGIYAAEQAMKDGSATGRTLATTLLAQDCDNAAEQLLEKTFTSDKSWAVRAASAKAIGQCGGPNSVAKLEQGLSDSHDAVRDMAAAAIIRLSSTEHPNKTAAGEKR
jgi:HEAT repeat protein